MATDTFGCVGHTIQTADRHYLDLDNPDPADISIEAIASGLSNICRFSGQLPEEHWYSVADHSLNCFFLANCDNMEVGALKAVLMHDASEAYIGDMAKPLKNLVGKAYKDVEKRLQKVIGEKYGIDFDKYEEAIRLYDHQALIAEKRWFFGEKSKWVGEDQVARIELARRPTTRVAARGWFLNIFRKLFKRKLLIIGHAGHGKDTLAKLMGEYGYTHQDSSRKALEIFLFDSLKTKYGYRTLEEAYQDRVNHRAEWYDEIRAFNTPDKTRLAKMIMRESDIYVGMRDRDEIEACVDERVFDDVIWVDASKRKPLEPSSSFNIDRSLADIVIDNNEDESDLRDAAKTLHEFLSYKEFP